MSDTTINKIPMTIFQNIPGMAALIANNGKDFALKKINEFNEFWETDFNVIEQDGHLFLISFHFTLAIEVCLIPEKKEEILDPEPEDRFVA